jgi:hypothetical protein
MTKRARDVFISDEATEALRDRRSVNYCVIFDIVEATGKPGNAKESAVWATSTSKADTAAEEWSSTAKATASKAWAASPCQCTLFWYSIYHCG